MRRVLVLNGGTATVKAALATIPAGGSVVIERRTTVALAAGSDPAVGFRAALARLDDELTNGLDDVAVVGHRVVHGGTALTAPTLLTAAIERAIADLMPLAPLHNPVALAGVAVARARFPATPMAAVFDTAFHAARPAAARAYALPADLVGRYALHRYGFHGIAHASLAAGLAAQDGGAASDVTAVTLQLGHGCSACAIAGGRSIETSMGFTPLAGLMMATRAGDVDPGLVLHLQRRGLTLDEVETLLMRESGLLGVGGSADVRDLVARETAGDARAALALALFVRRIVMTVGAYFTLLDGRGALVFGGGIGEHSAEIRSRVAAGLAAWNVRLDPERNTAGRPGSIAAEGSRVVAVIPTDEESLIAAAVARLVPESAGAG